MATEETEYVFTEDEWNIDNYGGSTFYNHKTLPMQIEASRSAYWGMLYHITKIYR